MVDAVKMAMQRSNLRLRHVALVLRTRLIFGEGFFLAREKVTENPLSLLLEQTQQSIFF